MPNHQKRNLWLRNITKYTWFWLRNKYETSSKKTFLIVNKWIVITNQRFIK